MYIYIVGEIKYLERWSNLAWWLLVCNYVIFDLYLLVLLIIKDLKRWYNCKIGSIDLW